MPAIAERNLRSVDLNLLVVFDTLMAERNVTRAAARNGLSQPAVSKALNRLRYLRRRLRHLRWRLRYLRRRLRHVSPDGDSGRRLLARERDE